MQQIEKADDKLRSACRSNLTGEGGHLCAGLCSSNQPDQLILIPCRLLHPQDTLET